MLFREILFSMITLYHYSLQLCHHKSALNLENLTDFKTYEELFVKQTFALQWFIILLS